MIRTAACSASGDNGRSPRRLHPGAEIHAARGPGARRLADAAPAYDSAQAAHRRAGRRPSCKWREFFTDERLQKVIETALNNNRDLRVAALNVERARALYGIQRAELSADGQRGRQRNASSACPPIFRPPGRRRPVEQYGVNLGIASWEIDFFGRIRSLKDVALRGVPRHRAGPPQRADPAGVRSRQRVPDPGRGPGEPQAGPIHPGDPAGRLRSDPAALRRRARRPNWIFARRRRRWMRPGWMSPSTPGWRLRTKTRLNLLVGLAGAGRAAAGRLERRRPAGEISPGMSSEVLLRRPDILQAENLLKAANANIGAARAAFFPRISLTAAVGTASGELSGLFRIRLGRLELLAAGRHADLRRPHMVGAGSGQGGQGNRPGPVREGHPDGVPGGGRRPCGAGHGGRPAGGAAISVVDAVAETYRLSNARYTKGIDSFLGVLDAQRSLYAAQQGLISIRLAKLANQVQALRGAGRGCVKRGQSTSGCRRSRRSASGTPRCPARAMIIFRSSGGSRPCGSRAARSGAA